MRLDDSTINRIKVKASWSAWGTREKIRDYNEARGNPFESLPHKEIAKLLSSVRFLSVFRDWISLQFSGVHRQQGTCSNNASLSRSYLTCTKVYRQLGKKQPDSSLHDISPDTSLPAWAGRDVFSPSFSLADGRRRGTSSRVSRECETRHKTTPTVVGYRRYIIAPSGKVAFSCRKCRGNAIFRRSL